MKRIIGASVIAIITTVGGASCKKSNTTAPTNAISHWELDGKKDTGTTTLYADQTNYLESNAYVSDTTTQILIIVFSTRPTANGKFEVVGQNTTINSKECGILGATITPSTPLAEAIESVGQPGDSVTVTIVNGKINASFSKIVIKDGGGFYSLISGDLIEQ